MQFASVERSALVLFLFVSFYAFSSPSFLVSAGCAGTWTWVVVRALFRIVLLSRRRLFAVWLCGGDGGDGDDDGDVGPCFYSRLSS